MVDTRPGVQSPGVASDGDTSPARVGAVTRTRCYIAASVRFIACRDAVMVRCGAVARRPRTPTRPGAAGRPAWRARSRAQQTPPPPGPCSSSGRTLRRAPCCARTRAYWATRARSAASRRSGRLGRGNRVCMPCGFPSKSVPGNRARGAASRRLGRLGCVERVCMPWACSATGTLHSKAAGPALVVDLAGWLLTICVPLN